MCNMQGAKVIGVWDESGRWYSCLTGVDLKMGDKRVMNGVKIDCLLSSPYPGRAKRVRCGTRTGHCTIKFIALESKTFGPIGFVRKGEEICVYAY